MHRDVGVWVGIGDARNGKDDAMTKAHSFTSDFILVHPSDRLPANANKLLDETTWPVSNYRLSLVRFTMLPVHQIFEYNLSHLSFT